MNVFENTAVRIRSQVDIVHVLISRAVYNYVRSIWPTARDAIQVHKSTFKLNAPINSVNDSTRRAFLSLPLCVCVFDSLLSTVTDAPRRTRGELSYFPEFPANKSPMNRF